VESVCPALAQARAGAPSARADARAEGQLGYLHSFQTGSAVDGPGLRFVLWTTGCLMRCLYCHNPDTWDLKHGRQVTLDEMMAEIGKYERVLKVTGGGVTVSGGEPLVQAPFVTRLLRACKERGLHTVLDTNGYLGDRIDDDALNDVDLVLLDLKAFDAATHQRVTGMGVDAVLRFARRLSNLGKPAWIRFVLVPGLTDAPDDIDRLAGFVATLDNVERVEVLPFHQLGRDKWLRLDRSYPLADTAPPNAALIARARAAFEAYGLPVR
jgi:pyruvate formate lyase activating enzyme